MAGKLVYPSPTVLIESANVKGAGRVESTGIDGCCRGHQFAERLREKLVLFNFFLNPRLTLPGVKVKIAENISKTYHLNKVILHLVYSK